MGHRETLLSLPATLDQLTPNCSPMTRASVRRSTASFKSRSGKFQHIGTRSGSRAISRHNWCTSKSCLTTF